MQDTPVEVKKVEHKSIYEALAAFQGENVELEKTKEFGKESDKMHFWYTPLGEVLKKVRPLTSKHGLSFTWTRGDKEDELVCVLYHETYTGKGEEHETIEERTIQDVETAPEAAGAPLGERIERKRVIRRPMAQGVLVSMPVKVHRSGDMKTVGGDSTYARRYTLAEVLGIAPEDDNDVADLQDRLEKTGGFAFNKAKEEVMKADDKRLTEQATFFEAELKKLAEGKKPSLGLTKEQYEELQKAVVTRRTELNKGGGKKTPGENHDNGGQATIGE